MFLAAIEGNLIALIIFAAIGVINWLAQKKQEAEENRPKPAAPESPPPRDRTARETEEEERLRKFMEALGLPPNAPPPSPRSTTTRPPIVAHTPASPPPTPVSKRTRPRLPREPRVTPPRSSPPPLPRGRARSLDEEDAPALPVEALSLPPLVTRVLPEFETVASSITAIPLEAAAALAERDAYQDREPQRAAPGNPIADLLRSRDDLRRAILLREVLGPPLGLGIREPLASLR
jgi:hypothetical protein